MHPLVLFSLQHVNAGLNPHQTPEQKCTTWPVLAGAKVHHLG